MSQDLLLSVRDVLGFSVAGWVGFLGRFGLGVSFPEGVDLADQDGFLPARVFGLVSAAPIDTGFDLDVSAPDGPGEAWEMRFGAVGGDGDEVWALALAAAAYFVVDLGGVLEDPQEGCEWGQE
ncbi:MAG: hypothetical protein LBO20_04175, partial [Bifidobacteriaceae bacterium]|nr:hypothetical protein [Bifidobacteriaceae bacterium]